MDIKKLADSIFIPELSPTLSQLELFAQKIIDARDAEWMSEIYRWMKLSRAMQNLPHYSPSQRK